MQRGIGSLARRAVIPQPLSATCLWRAEERRGGAKKRVKPYEKYKGKKGELEGLLQASNKWNYNWYKTYDSLPDEIKREQIYMPYANDFLVYNPNDPAELKRFLSRKKAEALREKNEEIQENKGVVPKEHDGDFRSYNLDQEWDDDADEYKEDDFMDEEFEEEDEVDGWRKKLAPKRQAEQKLVRAARREKLIEQVRKRMIAFEKMSDADKVKKLTELRAAVRKEYVEVKSSMESSKPKTQEEALEILKTKYKITPEQEEKLLRAIEQRPTEEEKIEFDRKYKMGQFKVEGELSGFDVFLQQRGKGRLVGFLDRLMSDAPPKLPAPIDIKLIESKAGGKPLVKEEKVEEKAADKAAKPAEGKGGDKGAAKPAPAAKAAAKK